jgi:hypothetical protein
MKQIITIDTLGNIETLKRKKGKGIDIAPLVKKQTIQRISLVEWDEENQKWFLTLQLGTLAGCVMSHEIVRRVTGAVIAAEIAPDAENARTALLWDDYDDAVKAEVEIIEQARLAGNGAMVGTAYESQAQISVA